MQQTFIIVCLVLFYKKKYKNKNTKYKIISKINI